MPDYGCSTWTQFTILLGRMFLQTWRNWVIIKNKEHLDIGKIFELISFLKEEVLICIFTK